MKREETGDGMKRLKKPYLIALVITAVVAGAFVLWRAGMVTLYEEYSPPPYNATGR